MPRQRSREKGVYERKRKCVACDGAGKIERRKCSECGGDGLIGTGVFMIDYLDAEHVRHRETIGTRALAEKVLAQKRTQVAEGRHFPRRERITLDEAMHRYVMGAGLGKLSHKDDENFCRLWSAQFGGKYIDRITTAHVERARNQWAQEFAKNTVNKRMSFLRRVLNVMIRDGLLTANPVAQVKFYRDEAASIPRWLDHAEESAIRAQFMVAGKNLWHIVEVAILTGMRQAEQFTLRWPQINFGTNLITLPRTKSGKARHIPMHARVREIMANLKLRAASEWVFSMPDGGPRNGRAFYRRHFMPAVAAAGLAPPVRPQEKKRPGDPRRPTVNNSPRQRRPINWHTCRHTTASRLVMAGVDLRTVMEIMGHTTLAITQRYAHLAPKHVDDAINRISGAPVDHAD